MTSASAIQSPEYFDFDHLVQKDRVHGSLYSNAALFELEMKKLYYGGWVFVGHDSEIPKIGDYQRRVLGREEVLFLRARDNSIRVMANRCSHRGNLLAIEKSGNTKYFTCQYHGWVFDLEGKLRDVPFPGGFEKDRTCMSVRSLKTEVYRGFVFASFNPEVGPLADHLGLSMQLIDRACDMSPVGRIRLSAGWVKHRFAINWKMLPEGDTDGYHVQYTHSSFAKVTRSHYEAGVLEQENALTSQTIDWGGGHTELYFKPMYKNYMEWLGVKPDRFPDYVADMKKAYGDEKGEYLLIAGAPHAVIFPNLFIGEMNIVFFQPINAHECIQWHTALLLEGVSEELNTRILRNSEAAMGPAGLLLADDGAIAERAQYSLRDRADWLDISRGLNRQHVDAEGKIYGHVSDECTNRAFWRHYKKVMSS
jgi:phenylpropionate dioxygenase-like ring-hydroxylating dioxygenase large terminal subunit